MMSSATYTASSTPARSSFGATLGAVWDALIYSLAMSREMADTGYVNQRQVKKVRRMAEHF